MTNKQRANRVTVQAQKDGGFAGRYYRTHRLLAEVRSEETGWLADTSASSTANREAFREYLVEHAGDHGIFFSAGKEKQAWSRKHNSYVEDWQVGEDAAELVRTALDRLAEKSRYDMTVDSVTMSNITAKPSNLSYVEYGKYVKSGAWCVADIEMTLTVTISGQQMDMLFPMEMRSGQICKPKMTIAEWNEMVAEEIEVNGVEVA